MTTMTNQEKKYLEEWDDLERATEKLKMEIFGLQCKIEGISEERLIMGVIPNKNDYEGLKNFQVALSGIYIEVTEENMKIKIPSELATEIEDAVTAEGFNVIDTMKVILNLRDAILINEAELLPGEETSYNNASMAGDLIDALQFFEKAFLNYMS